MRIPQIWVTSFLVLLPSAIAAGAIEFTKLPIEEVVTTMTVTEDGKWLVLAHEAKNELSIWDVATHERVATVKCLSPRSVISRRDKIYVANYGHGTVSVVPTTNDWKTSKQFDIGSAKVFHLTAPQGQYFQDEIVCNTMEHVVLLNTKDGSRSNLPTSHAEMLQCDYQGEKLITQKFTDNRCCAIDFDTLRRRERRFSQSARGKHVYRCLLYQAHRGEHWIDGRGLSKGFPPEVVGTPRGTLLIPDSKYRLFYQFDDSNVTCFSAYTLEEFGSLAYQCPDELERLKPRRHPMAGDYVNYDRYFRQYAVTQGDHLHFFVLDGKSSKVYVATTKRFNVPITITRRARLPRFIVAGKPFSHRLYGENVQGEFQLMDGPTGVEVSSRGELTWNPTKENVGSHLLRLRVDLDGRTTFESFDIKVVDAQQFAVTGGEIPKLRNLGRHKLSRDGSYRLSYSRDMKSILLLTGHELKILDENGFVVLQTIDLETKYKRIFEREEYYVALSENSVDMLDKETLKLSKRIDLDCTRTNDLAIHPARAVSYVSVFDAHIRDPLLANPIVRVDEAKAIAERLEGTRSTRLEADPTGHYLFVSFKSGSVELLSRFDVRSGLPRRVETNLRPGNNGFAIALAPDGRHIGYVAGGGTPGYGYGIPSFSVENLKTPAVVYQPGGHPRAITYHPTLDIVAAAGGRQSEIFIFDRSSGKQLESHFVKPTSLLGYPVNKLFFTPRGNHLIVGYGGFRDTVHHLISVELNLSKEERETTAKGFTAPKFVTQSADTQISDELLVATPQRISLTEIGALEGRAASRDVSPKEIARHFTQSVVVIRTPRGIGTGMVVGADGYILTCAHVVAPGTDLTVSYNKKPSEPDEKETQAVLLRLDRDNDLALIKIKPDKSLIPVQFLMKNSVESGDEVTVIGNPGVGETVLTNTVTTGVVSTPNRSLEDRKFIQTSAPVNPGTSGGPMFNDRGQVIGVVVMKANIENTGFAIPLEHVKAFFDNISQTIDDTRIWRDSTGRELKAALVAVKKDEVQLRSKFGKTIVVPYDRLSKHDQLYVDKQRNKGIPNEDN